MKTDLSPDFPKKLEELYKHVGEPAETFEKESSVLLEIVGAISEKISNDYDILDPIGMGGAGVVIVLKDKHLNLLRALKVPRPKQHKELFDSVRTERDYLTQINHENIIGIYALGEVEVPTFPHDVPYFIMDYIKDARDLRDEVEKRLDESDGTKDLAKITRWLVHKFNEIAEAIAFLHKREIIHFDIKPGNILVDEKGKAILSDLGFAKQKKRGEKSGVVVGFTLFYAHKLLKDEYGHMSHKYRVRKMMSPNEFKYEFDLYAFGKGLLEILSVVDNKFPDAVVYDYNFVYLHLAGCRMLDGYNLSNHDTENIRQKQIQNQEKVKIYRETWVEFDQHSFDEIKYTNFDEVKIDLQKLMTGKLLLENIVELNPFYSKRIQCSEGTPAPFSERVKKIIEHPVFSRLISVPQLGLLSSTYPTATHNRFEHSIGVFRNCCLYIQALYNDQHNPLFKQLVNENDIKCLLLAGLLHDLGQYPLAHELEEIISAFKHENFNGKFLYSSIKDNTGKTLMDIIEDEKDGWGVSIEMVKKLITPPKRKYDMFEKENIKETLLRSLIDGPIDADKLDYIMRDSQNCYLTYGSLVDFDRLIRNLTIIAAKPKNGERFLAIGVYDKGQSAAESLTLARYLMYQALYWHHTNRAVRSMLRAAVMPILEKRYRAQKAKYEDFMKALEKRVINSKDFNAFSNIDMLDIINDWTNDTGKEFITMIKERKYFKRIVTIHHEETAESGKKTFLELFREATGKVGFAKTLQQQIMKALATELDHIQTSRLSILAEQRTKPVLKMLSEKEWILCDAPKPSYGTAGQLRIIPEPQKLHQNYWTRAEAGMRVSEVWNQVYFNLMNIAARGRVFCHPEIRDILTAALGVKRLKNIVQEVVNEIAN